MTGDNEPLAALPGGDLVVEGLSDLRAGRETAAALLVAMAAERLREAAIDVPGHAIATPSHRLYELLEREEGAGAHARYNALVRRIASFARAAEHAVARSADAAPR